MEFLPPDRDISKLEENFKKKAVYFLNEVAPMGVFLTEGWRSNARQQYLRLKGLSKTITSYHQKGLAIDIAFKDDTRTKQVERELYPEDMKRWREVAKIANKYGIDWGYDLWNWDKPHFQCNGKKFIESINFTMTKAQKDAIDNCIYSFKCLYHLGDEELKRFAIKKANELRELKNETR